MYNIFLINLLLYFKTYSLLTTLFVFYTYIRTLLCVSLCTKNYYSSNQVYKAAPHNSKCRCGEREVQAAKQKAQIILCAAKVSAASGGCSEPKQGQRSQSARGFCPEARCGYRNPTLSSILATLMPCRTPSRSEALRSATAACGGSWRGDPLERCLSR